MLDESLFVLQRDQVAGIHPFVDFFFACALLDTLRKLFFIARFEDDHQCLTCSGVIVTHDEEILRPRNAVEVLPRVDQILPVG